MTRSVNEYNMCRMEIFLYMSCLVNEKKSILTICVGWKYFYTCPVQLMKKKKYSYYSINLQKKILSAYVLSNTIQIECIDRKVSLTFRFVLPVKYFSKQ